MSRPAKSTSARPAEPVARLVKPAPRFVPKARRPWWLINAMVIGAVASGVIHGALMLLNFTVPEFKLTKQSDRGLDIVLVNARHAKAPRDPQALAQANLDGGGNSDDKRAMPTSPLPPENAQQAGDSLVETQRRQRELETRQRQLLAQARSPQTMPVEQHRNPELPTETEPPRPNALDLTNQARAIARQEAAVERALQEYARRPKKSFVGARTQEYRFAQYVETWRNKIERVGALNFPQNRGKQLYGNLLLSVELAHDGSIIRSNVERSSGNRALDEHALRILHLAAPFAPFPDNIRKDTDVLVITRTWTFVNEKLTAQ